MTYRDKEKRKAYLRDYMRSYRKKERELIRLARQIKSKNSG